MSRGESPKVWRGFPNRGFPTPRSPGGPFPQKWEGDLRKLFMTMTAAASLVGCATPQPSWVAQHRRDSFTDEVSCRVSPPDLPMSVFSPLQFVYYPFVERHGADVRVGLTSGDRFKVPVGAVRVRIDGQPSWTIETSETPLDMVPTTFTSPSAYLATQPTAVKEAIAQASKNMTASISQAMSPFTVTNGEKAAKIIQQMKQGHEIIYETLGVNQTSRTGRQSLGPDFLTALADCGI